MQSTTGNARIVRQVADGTPGQALDLLGPVAEFVTEPEPQGSFCVLRGVLPPGMTVPLHSHDDAEDFLVLTGPSRSRAWLGVPSATRRKMLALPVVDDMGCSFLVCG